MDRAHLKKRMRLAQSVERAAVPERPYIGRGPRYLVHPTVTAACAPALHVIAAALRDDAFSIDETSMRSVTTFLRDGSSPFFGRDPIAALRDLVERQYSIVGAETAVPDEERFAIAV